MKDKEYYQTVQNVLCLIKLEREQIADDLIDRLASIGFNDVWRETLDRKFSITRSERRLGHEEQQA